MTLGANQIAAYAADLLDTEADIAALQDSKRDIYQAIRDEHGRVAADALKRAVKLSRMDSGKRDEAEAVDTEAQRMLAIIEKAGHAPRAMRVATSVPDPSSDARNMVESTGRIQSNSGHDILKTADLDTTPDPQAQPLDTQSPSVTDEAQTQGVRDGGAPSLAGAEGDADRPPISEAVSASNVTPFRNSKGIPRQPGCLNPETCAGMWNARCFACEQAFHATEFVQVELQGQIG